MASSVWYVDPRVSGDRGDGSEADPWSLGHALKGASRGIHAGDTVLLRGGTYASSPGYTVQNVAAEAGATVTFQAYPGEVPLIDGAIAAFQTPGNEAWVADPEAPRGQNVWHSRELFASNRAPYLGMIELQGELITLATHVDRARLTSSEDRWKSDLTHYVGPGIAFEPDSSDTTMGRIYIRLDNTSDEAQAGRYVVRIDDFDPSHHAIHIGGRDLYGLNIQASHLRFVGLHFRGHYGCWGVLVSGVRGLVFEDCVGEPQRFVARLGPSAEDVRILGGSYTAHMPSSKWWASVADIHSGPPAPAAPAKTAFDLGKAASQVEIGPSRRTGQRMLLRQFFDGIIASGPVRDVEVHGVWFDEIWDDAFEMTLNLRNVHYHDNLHYGAGPSRTDENEGIPDGSIHIHDNVIDTTIRPIFRYRGGFPETPAVREAIAFSSHGQPAENEPAFPWRLYHNTVVTGDRPGSSQIGVGLLGLNRDPAQPRHEVYNNIYVVPSGQPVATRVSSISTVPNRGLEIYDGNCFFSNGAWTPTNPPYRLIHTSTGELNPGPWPLEAFRASQAVKDSQTYYRRSGWESSAIETNPLLDDAYLPLAPEAQTGSVDLSLTGWPGTEPYRAQRGARLTAPLPAGAIPENGDPR